MSKTHHFINDKNKSESKDPSLSIYSIHLNNTLYPFILDHRLNHNALVPASWYLDTAFRIASEKLGYPFRLSEIRYPKALLMNGHEDYQIILEILTDSGKLNCEFYALEKGAEEKLLCASCSIQKITEVQNQNADIDSIRSRCSKKLNHEEFYQQIAGYYLNFGPLHQGIQSIQVGKDEAIGYVKHLEQLSREQFFAHPSFIDAFSHVGLSLIDPVNAGDVLVTASQDAFELYSPIPDETWCYAKVTHRDKNEISLDVSIYSLEGKLIGRVVNYRLKAVNQFQVFPQLYEYFTLGWEKQSLDKNTTLKETIRPFLITNHEKFGKTLSETIKNLKIFNLKDKEECIQEVAKKPQYSALLIHISAIEDIYEGNLSTLLTALEIIQKLMTAGVIQLYRLVILTEGQPLSQAGLTGFCQDVNQENPLYHIQLMDFDQFNSNTASHVMNELIALHDEQHISYKNDQRHVYRLLPVNESKEIDIEPKGAYLITGGLGGIGHAITQWLLEKGVKKIVLLGRSKPTEAQMKILLNWNQKEERIQTLQCDVSDTALLREIVTHIHNQPFPIKGIFHAAGVNRDNTISKLTKEDFESVFKPKILGTLALAKATEGITLDHFVLFSSVTSFLGTSGVANYAAANSFLDAFAAFKGIKSLNWGPWEKGLLSKLGPEVRTFWENQGFKVLTDQEGTMRLGKAIGLPCSNIAIMPVNWFALFKVYSENTKISFLNTVMKALGYRQKDVAVQSSIIEDLKNASEDDRRDILLDFILVMAQNLTGTDVSDTSLPFKNLGFDSIATVEMTRRLQNVFLIQLPQTLLYNYTSIDALTDYLLTEKFKLDEPKMEEAPTKPKQKGAAAESLSDEELRNLLNDTLDDVDKL